MDAKYYDFEELGIDRLVEILALWNSRFTNIKSSSIPLEKRKTLLITAIREKIRTKPDHLKFKQIKEKYFTKKEKEEKGPDPDLLKYNIGDHVIYNDGKYRSKWVLAKVRKFNSKSLTIQLDSYRVISDDYALRNQTYGSDRLVWSHCFGERKVVITDSKKIYSKQDCIDRGVKWYLEYFREGQKSVDYGC